MITSEDMSHRLKQLKQEGRNRDHQALLEELGVDPKVCALISSLHTGSWFKYQDLDTLIIACKGGRQGCKLGALIFNLI